MTGKISRATGETLAKRRQFAFQLRSEFTPIEDVVRQVKAKFKLEHYTESMAYADVRQFAAEARQFGAQDRAMLIALEVERLDRISDGCQNGVEKGNFLAIQLALKTSAQRVAMLGLSSSVQEQVTERLAVEVDSLLALLQERLAPEVYQGVVEALESSHVTGNLAITGSDEETGADGDIEVEVQAVPDKEP